MDHHGTSRRNDSSGVLRLVKASRVLSEACRFSLWRRCGYTRCFDLGTLFTLAFGRLEVVCPGKEVAADQVGQGDVILRVLTILPENLRVLITACVLHLLCGLPLLLVSVSVQGVIRGLSRGVLWRQLCHVFFPVHRACFLTTI